MWLEFQSSHFFVLFTNDSVIIMIHEKPDIQWQKMN